MVPWKIDNSPSTPLTAASTAVFTVFDPSGHTHPSRRRLEPDERRTIVLEWPCFSPESHKIPVPYLSPLSKVNSCGTAP